MTKPDTETPRITFAARTHAGKVRARNEDALAVNAERGWAVLADGMGGYQGGDVAATLAVSVIAQRLERDLPGTGGAVDEVRSVLLDAVRAANRDIFRSGIEDEDLAGMGSTVVVAVFVADAMVCAHVGDSRLYRLGNRGFQRLTRDHTVLQELLDDGIMTFEESCYSPVRGLLTRGLGVGPDVEPDAGVFPALAGDVFIWCSDGLTGMLDDTEIHDLVVRLDDVNLIADGLIDFANARGGSDNISVVIARLAAERPF